MSWYCYVPIIILVISTIALLCVWFACKVGRDEHEE
jgi:hypothetical protein